MMHIIEENEMDIIKGHKLIPVDSDRDMHTRTYKCLGCNKYFMVHYRYEKESESLKKIINDDCK